MAPLYAADRDSAYLAISPEKAMYRGRSKEFKVVTKADGTFAVWFADAPPQFRWQDTGRYGSENECWDYVESNESSDGFWFQFTSKGG